MAKPDVTVVIPAYNPDLDELRRAVDSANANDSVAEVIVVMDGAGGIVPDIEGASTYVAEATGVVDVRNYGLSLVKTRWVIFLDQDDEYEPGSIDVMRSAVSRKTEYAYGDTDYPLQSETHQPGAWHPDINVEQFGVRYGILWNTANKVTFWQPDDWSGYPYNDWDLVLQLEKAGVQGVYVGQKTLRRWKKPTGMMSQLTAEERQKAFAVLAERWGWKGSTIGRKAG